MSTAFGSDRGSLLVPAHSAVLDILRFRGRGVGRVADVEATVSDLTTQAGAKVAYPEVEYLDDSGAAVSRSPRSRARAAGSAAPRRSSPPAEKPPGSQPGVREDGDMYIPRFTAIDDDQARALVESAGSAELVTVGDDGFPLATRLPVLWQGDRLICHLAIANPHWRSIRPGSPALAVVTGPEAYVSPGWYAAKAEHGRVVPTWNYSAVHLIGRATVHRDAAWLREAVTALTDRHEGLRPEPWAVTDAPEAFVDQQLRAIVGVELVVERVEGKAKRSQNRSEADRLGVIAGLAGGSSSEQAMAAQMRADLATDTAAADR
ncbi:FMN-binding negative transcriptional regulator [Nocardioides sp.]|uniref:FMN-binding negative transcriptional regulator n=1 Tax=Nocardioides sp. TaxID=35761 RepID=UPI003528E298